MLAWADGRPPRVVRLAISVITAVELKSSSQHPVRFFGIGGVIQLFDRLVASIVRALWLSFALRIPLRFIAHERAFTTGSSQDLPQWF